MTQRISLVLSLLLVAPVPLRAQVSPDAGSDVSEDDGPASDRPEGVIRPVGKRPVAPASSETDADFDSDASEDASRARDDDAEAEKIERGASTTSADDRFEAAEDESIYIVQRRAYSKRGNFEVTPIFYTAVNPKFVGYGGAAVSAAYHLRENFALELLASVYNTAFYSGLVLEVFDYEQLTPEEVDLKQLASGPGAFGALSAQFSALYGKLEFYGWLLDYDFYLSAGLGWARTEEPCIPNRGDCSEEVDVGRGLQIPADSSDANKITGNLGGGMRLFFADWIGLRVEVRDIAYSDRKVETTQSGAVGQTTTDIRNNLMLFLGASFML